MTIFFSNSEIQIYRQRRIGATNRYAMSATFTGYSMDIQPASPDRAEMVDGKYGQVYTGFIDASVSIKEGDQVLVGGLKRYSVRGVVEWTGAGLLDHKELTLVSEDGS